MSLSMNIHPDGGKWETVRAEVWGDKNGNAVMLFLGSHNIALHYGDSENENEFVSKLKETVAALPNKCKSCGQNI